MRVLDYTLEFFAVDRGGQPERLERLRLRAVSAEDAEQQARAYVKNILIDNRPIDRCLIKNQAGSAIKEVQRSALTENLETDRRADAGGPIADRARMRPAAQGR